MVTRTCAAHKPNGEPCQAPPLLDGDHCLMHDPDRAEEVAEARRLGGLRRRREVVLRTTYDVGPLDSVPAIRRLVEMAVADTLELENSISRSRTLAYLAQNALRLLEVSESDAPLQIIDAGEIDRDGDALAHDDPWSASTS